MIIHYNCTIGCILLHSFLLICHPYPPSFHEMIFTLVYMHFQVRGCTDLTDNQADYYKNYSPIRFSYQMFDKQSRGRPYRSLPIISMYRLGSGSYRKNATTVPRPAVVYETP